MKAVLLVTAATAICCCSASATLAGTSSSRDAAASVVRVYRLGLFHVSFADRDMRHCDARNDCATAISSLSSIALLWMAATNRIDNNGLSPLGRRVKANIF